MFNSLSSSRGHGWLRIPLRKAGGCLHVPGRGTPTMSMHYHAMKILQTSIVEVVSLLLTCSHAPPPHLKVDPACARKLRRKTGNQYFAPVCERQKLQWYPHPRGALKKFAREHDLNNKDFVLITHDICELLSCLTILNLMAFSRE